VLLVRGDARLDAVLPVPRGLELRTATEFRFQTAEDALFEAGETEVLVPVRALRTGRDGELARTGSAVEWQGSLVGATPLGVRNEAPIRLPRVVHEPAEKRVEAKVEERFVADRVRAAAGEKSLQVHVLVSIALDGTLDGETRAAVEEAVRGYVGEAADREPPRIEEGEVRDRVEAVLAASTASPFELRVRIRTVDSDGEVLADQPYVEPGFVERIALASVFVHTRTLPLAGTLPLTLPLTATAAEKEQVRRAVREAIAEYLDSLGPEEPVMLERLRTAAELPGVVETGVFIPAPPLRERVEKREALRVEPLERVVLDPTVLAFGG
jgi:hypothetical protein